MPRARHHAKPRRPDHGIRRLLTGARWPCRRAASDRRQVACETTRSIQRHTSTTASDGRRIGGGADYRRHEIRCRQAVEKESAEVGAEQIHQPLAAIAHWPGCDRGLLLMQSS
jgi:hypothetical protein